MMVLLGINGIMRISWQFHGDILETSWEYDWAYHGSHGSRGNRITLSQGSEYPQGSASWGHNHYHLRADTQFQNISWELLIVGSTSVTSVYGILPDFDNYHAPQPIGQDYVGY
jgi:hypothetical protein